MVRDLRRQGLLEEEHREWVKARAKRPAFFISGRFVCTSCRCRARVALYRDLLACAGCRARYQITQQPKWPERFLRANTNRLACPCGYGYLTVEGGRIECPRCHAGRQMEHPLVVRPLFDPPAPLEARPLSRSAIYKEIRRLKASEFKEETDADAP